MSNSIRYRNSCNNSVNNNEEWSSATANDNASLLHAQGDDDHDSPALTMSLTPGHSSVGVSSGLYYTRGCVTITAKDIPDDDTKRAPVDIVVALDISSSMTGTKLDLCKQTLQMLLREFTPRDRFGLIAYSSHAKVVCPILFMTSENKKKVLKALKHLRAKGHTNLSGGLTLAAQELRMVHNPNVVRCVFLLTDGHANRGITDTYGIASMISPFVRTSSIERQMADVTLSSSCCDNSNIATTSTPTSSTSNKRSSCSTDITFQPPESISLPSPISIHCFGYGANHNSEMLQGIANGSPGGTYYFVENDCDVGSAFGDAIGGCLSVVAQCATVTLQVPPEAQALGARIAKVHHDEAIERNFKTTYTVNVGDFYAQESRDIIFDIVLTSTTISSTAGGTPPSIPHVTATLTYMDTIIKANQVEGPVTCSIARPAGTDIAEMDHNVKAQLCRIYATRQMKLADDAAKHNDIASARRRIQDAITKLNNTNEIKSHPTFQQVKSDLSDVLRTSLSSARTYSQVGKHKLSGAQRQLKAQRSSESTTTKSNIYSSSKKGKYAAKYKFN